MSVATERKAPWFTKEYSRIEWAQFGDQTLTVAFADGSIAKIAVDRLRSRFARNPDWDQMRYDHFEIVVPSDTEDLEIPWSTIRTLTDPAYDAHLEAAAKREARHVGERIHAFRAEQGLTVAELAARVGLDEAQMARLEAGEAGISLETIGRTMTALGHSLRDLIIEPVGAVTS